MEKHIDKSNSERAIERWENEGGEVLAIPRFNIEKKKPEKRRHGKPQFNRRILRNPIG